MHSMIPSTFICLTMATICTISSSFVAHGSRFAFSSRRYTRSSTPGVEDGVDLSILENVDEDASYLRNSIQKWLDSEFIKQTVHQSIANKVEEVYRKERIFGTKDLGQLLVSLGTSLENFEMRDSFVNSWDIANKVSDILMMRMNRELCSCAGDMSLFSGSLDITKEAVTNAPSLDLMKAMTDDLRPTFERYMFMREFLEGERSWEEARAVLSLIVGYRVNDHGFLYHKNECAPYGWKDLSTIPDFCTITEDNPDVEARDDAIAVRLEADLPGDNYAMDMVMESVVGIEGFKMLKTDSTRDPTIRRRLLLGKWMYVNGFLTDDFPATDRFIPGHVITDDTR